MGGSQHLRMLHLYCVVPCTHSLLYVFPCLGRTFTKLASSHQHMVCAVHADLLYYAFRQHRITLFPVSRNCQRHVRLRSLPRLLALVSHHHQRVELRLLLCHSSGRCSPYLAYVISCHSSRMLLTYIHSLVWSRYCEAIPSWALGEQRRSF